MARRRQYWLFKSEPDVYSFDDLAKEPEHDECWEGIRNYQARNYLRDEIKVDDGVLFYHSRVAPMEVVGCARVTRAGYPDPFQFKRKHRYFDPGSDPNNPRWYTVDIRFDKRFARPVTLKEIKATEELVSMLLVQNSRLSIQPVTGAAWNVILRLGLREPRRRGAGSSRRSP